MAVRLQRHLVMTEYMVECRGYKTKADGPSDPDFFGREIEGKEKKAKIDKAMLRLRDLYPDDLERYLELFVHRSDHRAFNTRLGYWDDRDVPFWEQAEDVMSRDWRPQVRGRSIDGKPLYVAATTNNLLPLIERHLDTGYWRSRGHRAKGFKQPFWVGTLGGRFTSSAAFDLDNHGGRVLKFTRDGGNYRVPDLGVEILDLARRVLGLPYQAYGLPIPTALSTSSDSLGLCVWIIPEAPQETAVLHARMKEMAADHGLPKLEVYPIPPARGRGPYEGRSVHRRPCGQGAVTLAGTGIIRGWREQVANFLAPRPLPSLPQVAEQLLELWLGLHQVWRPNFLDVPGERLDHFNQRCREIRDWVRRGCPPLVDGGAEAVAAVEVVRRAGKRSSSACPKVSLPEGWESWPYPERLYYIARRGCPAEGMLNECLIMLARHMMAYELDGMGDEERDEVAFSVLEAWCLSCHNGCSGRLSEGDTALPKDVESVIWRDIRSVSCREPSAGVKNTLRVRHLITGEGPRNGFVPRFRQGGREEDLLSVYTSEESPAQGDEYRQAEARVIEAIRSGLYDHETIEAVEEKIAPATPTFQRFARRLANFLMMKDNRTANIHTNIFKAMADTSSPTTATKYKRAALDEKVIKVVSHKYRIGGQSKSYQLHPNLRLPGSL